MRKKIVAKGLEYRSELGSGLFKNVPVFVDVSVDAKAFDQAKDTYGLGGDVIDILEREIAKQWLKGFLEKDADGNYVRRWALTRDETNAIMHLLRVNASEFAKLLGISKGQVSKILAGDQHVSPVAARFAAFQLAHELAYPGFARSFLSDGEIHFEIGPDALVPQYDFRKLAA